MESNNIELITRMVIQAINQNEKKGDGFMVPIGVSARHIHLTQEHVEALFGPGYQLTKKKALMGGQFASNEKVTIVGLKLRAIENVRVLGPVRKNTQVEISATDAISLGVKAPIRESGNIAGSAPIAIIGPKGAVYLNEGCIVAKRHIHMAPKDAMAAGVHDGDIVSVKADNERGTIFNNVQIRVDDSFTLEMHIDTDEANAKYFHNNVVKASAHYFVDDDSYTKSVPLKNIAWSVGGKKYPNCGKTGGGKKYGLCTNANSINIELCDTVKDGKAGASAVTIQNAVTLTKKLMKKYNIDKAHVVRHFDVTGKACPAYWVDDKKWKKEFLDKL